MERTQNLQYDTFFLLNHEFPLRRSSTIATLIFPGLRRRPFGGRSWDKSVRSQENIRINFIFSSWNDEQ